MKIIINSNILYFPHSYEKISKNAVYIENKEKFLFIVGAADKEEIDRNIIYTKTNSLDFNALIYLVKNPQIIEEDAFFYTHDTCDFGPNFINLMGLKMKEHRNARLFIQAQESAYVGIYSKQKLKDYEKEIMSFYNIEKTEEKLNYLKTMVIHNESFLLRENPFLCKERQVSGPYDIYNNGVQRISEYFPEIDYYKFKANWFLKRNYELKI